MAKKILSTVSDRPMDEERIYLCLSATWEAAGLLDMLANEISPSENQFHLKFRGVESRLRALFAVLMNGLGDDLVSNDDMKNALDPKGART